jgi:magnesium transporter
MIKTMLHNPKTGKTIYGDEGLFSEWKHNTDLWIWADFDNEDLEHEKTLFEKTFGLHPLAISDAQNDRHPPKLEAFDDHFFLLVSGLDKISKGIDFGILPISFFICNRFLVTRRALESVSIDKIWNLTKKGNIKLSNGIAHITYLILLQITDRYTSVVLELENRLEEMEDDMFENPRDALLEELISYGRTLKRLRRIFEYHQYLFKGLSRQDSSFLKMTDHHEFNDLLEHTERLASLTILYKELTDDLMNGYISITGHRLNQIMKILTVVTVVFLPLTLIAGIYGMNFEYIPELKVKSAYFILLGFMSFIAIILLIVFRKMRWI